MFQIIEEASSDGANARYLDQDQELVGFLAAQSCKKTGNAVWSIFPLICLKLMMTVLI